MKIKTILSALIFALLIPCLDSCTSTKKKDTSIDDKHIDRNNIEKSTAPPVSQTTDIEDQKVKEVYNISDEIETESFTEEKNYATATDALNNNGNVYFDSPTIVNNTENYGEIKENQFKNTLAEPLSTFSLDVDRASYSNIRRMLLDGQLPPSNSVRIEEMINYFNYKYKQPKNSDPIAMHSNLTECPWNDEHQILHVGQLAYHLNLHRSKKNPQSSKH